METTEIEKKYYRLWIDYLKQSSDYKDFCQWMVKKRKNPNLPIPEKFHKAKNGSAPKEIFNFLTFGNIHDPKFSFNKWWQGHKKKLNYTKLHKSPSAIEDFTEHIGGYIKSAIDSFKSHFQREPSLQELKEWLTEHLMKKVFANSLYLMVDITDDTVIEQFKRLVKKKKEDPHIRRHYLTLIKNRQPIINYEVFEELQTYLDVYKLREQGLKPQEVIKAHNPKHNTIDKGYDSVERLYRIYYQKAKAIKKNVEHGFFPYYLKKRKAKLT